MKMTDVIVSLRKTNPDIQDKYAVCKESYDALMHLVQDLNNCTTEAGRSAMLVAVMPALYQLGYDMVNLGQLVREMDNLTAMYTRKLECEKDGEPDDCKAPSSNQPPIPFEGTIKVPSDPLPRVVKNDEQAAGNTDDETEFNFGANAKSAET